MNYSPTNSARNIILVGNKSDLADERRQVSFGQAELLARQLGLAGVVETSAKEGSDSLFDAFYVVTANAVDLVESEHLSQQVAF